VVVSVFNSETNKHWHCTLTCTIPCHSAVGEMHTQGACARPTSPPPPPTTVSTVVFYTGVYDRAPTPPRPKAALTHSRPREGSKRTRLTPSVFSAPRGINVVMRAPHSSPVRSAARIPLGGGVHTGCSLHGQADIQVRCSGDHRQIKPLQTPRVDHHLQDNREVRLASS